MNERLAVSRIGGVALDRKVGAVEQKLRLELAAVFRVAHHLGWNVDTLNHISLRIPGTDTFLMNPQALGWDEITASSLSTLDYNWNVLSHSGLKIQPAGYNFHSGILKARPDVNCVMHVHETAGTLVGALDEPEPLVVLAQGGCRLYQEVGYHGFEGLAEVEDEVPRMLADLGTSKHALIMRNHGLLTHRRHARRGLRLHARVDRRLPIAGPGDVDRAQAASDIAAIAGPHQGADERPPRQCSARRHLLGLLAAAGRAARSGLRGLSGARAVSGRQQGCRPPAAGGMPADRRRRDDLVRIALGDRTDAGGAAGRRVRPAVVEGRSRRRRPQRLRRRGRRGAGRRPGAAGGWPHHARRGGASSLTPRRCPRRSSATVAASWRAAAR